MSETSEPIMSEPINDAPLSHRRILLLTGLIGVLGTLISFIYAEWRFGIGLFIGGILAFVNYYWLKFSLKKVFDEAEEGEKPRISAIRYMSRYFALALILTFISLLKLVPIVAVILGLTSFAVALVLEGFIKIFTSVFKKEI